jgi:hypothetical protein
MGKGAQYRRIFQLKAKRRGRDAVTNLWDESIHTSKLCSFLTRQIDSGTCRGRLATEYRFDVHLNLHIDHTTGGCYGSPR